MGLFIGLADQAIVAGEAGVQVFDADVEPTLVIINEFGQVGLDHQLVRQTDENVVLMENGCICCSLQGDLLRTLKQVLTNNAPDLIVIEASGVADPQGIIEALMDPVLWPAVLLDSVVCLVDAQDVIATPARSATSATT